MKPKAWKILDWGSVERAKAHEIDYTCVKCWQDSALPIMGLVMAQCDDSLVFDIGHHAVPRRIRCPHCKRTLELCDVLR